MFKSPGPGRRSYAAFATAWHVNRDLTIAATMLVIPSSVMQRFDGAEHYVDGALRLLQYVEARRPTGRRFGADADARWSSFRGDLETVDRIELMIRDADAEWPGGFGARVVFSRPAFTSRRSPRASAGAPASIGRPTAATLAARCQGS